MHDPQTRMTTGEQGGLRAKHWDVPLRISLHIYIEISVNFTSVFTEPKAVPSFSSIFYLQQ